MKTSYILIIFILIGLYSCKKDSVFEEYKLEGNYYDPNDSSNFIKINNLTVNKWGITLNGDTNTLEAIIEMDVPIQNFSNNNVFDSKAKVQCIIYLNGKPHFVNFKNGIYTFNNFYSQMKNRENTLILYAKLINKNNELRKISNVYKFRIN